MATVTVNETVKGNGVTALTERVEKLRDDTLNAKLHADGERIRLYTEAWKAEEGQPLEIRRAKSLKNYFEGVTPMIFDGELIVGSPTRFRLAAMLTLEYDSEPAEKIVKGIDFSVRQEGENAQITEEDREAIVEAFSYWKGKSTRELFMKRWEEILGDKFLTAIGATHLCGLMADQPSSTKVPYFEKVFAVGLKGLIGEAKEQISQLDYSQRDAIERYECLQGMIIALEGMITFAGRYSQLAREMAEREPDPARKKELQEIAKVCAWVPENPPRNFREGLQTMWFMQLGEQAESPGNEAEGRMDQYLYPLYERDIREGRLTRDEAAELLGCLWVKLSSMTRFVRMERQEIAQGNQGDYVTLGGVIPESGLDATNELSFLILEVARQLKQKRPSIALRWHEDIDENFLLKGIETNVELQGGIPAFISDKTVIPTLVSYGITLEDARSYGLRGCVNPCIPGSHLSTVRISISPVKIFEMALNNGTDLFTGKQIGLATGDPRSFNSYEELLEAFKKQFRHWIQILGKAGNIACLVRTEQMAFPFISAVQRDCIKEGKDITSGEVDYTTFSTGINLRGCQSLANSLAAVKKLVYEEKKVSMDELLKALSANFEGYEELQEMCLAAPKWGNDDDYVDQIHADLWNFTGDVARHDYVSPVSPSGEGIPQRSGATSHYWAGLTIGATPDGRKAFQPLADGAVSPAYGTDKCGPTAAINSANKLDFSKGTSGLFNMKFPASLMKTEDNRRKVLELIRTYFVRGGYHIQFNIVDAATLRDAREHPEKYRHLMVRVAGFSAYFVELPAAVQDEIIARAELEL